MQKTGIYKFQLEKHPAIKGTCPQCKKQKVFRYYQNASKEFGICDRVNECGANFYPNSEISPQTEMLKPLEPKVITVYPTNQFCKATIENQRSNFHQFCKTTETLKITDEHFLKWNCGTIEDKTAFVYQNKDQQFFNIVHIEYSENGKRNKEKVPYSLKAKPGTKYPLCLFGEHLLSPDKTICVVESEKTAVIASFFYPQFDWLATGGANKLTDEKIEVLFGRQIFYLSDADIAGRENSTIKKLSAYELNYKIIHLFPNKTDGFDLADAIIEGLRPTIKSKVNLLEKNTIIKIEENKNNRVKNDFIILREYLQKTWDFRYNEVRNELEYKLKEHDLYEELREPDIYCHLRERNIGFKKADFEAILKSSFMSSYNPIIEYFNNLPLWDKVTDYAKKYIEYLTYKGNLDIKKHFTKWCVRTVKCVFEPKYFNKQMFVMVGKQNDGKTTFLRHLVPNILEKFYTENPDFRSKDGEISLSQNFIINMDELANIGKEDNDKLKTFISKQSINLRRPFERNTKSEPRRASFVGSTNNSEFLTDHTGNVRWMIFPIETINFNYSNDFNIDNLWSQILHLYKEDYICEISKEELVQMENNNEQYKIETPEMAALKEFFREPSKDDIAFGEFMSSNDVISYLEGLNQRYRSLNCYKMGKALTSLKFLKEQKRKVTGAIPIKGYYLTKI